MLQLFRQKITGTQKPSDKAQKTEAAYCRVSIDSDEQESSYETQIEHYTSFIKSHPDWELVEYMPMTAFQN